MAWEFNLLYWFQSIHSEVGDAIWMFITKFGDHGIFWGLVMLFLLIFVKDKRVGLTCFIAMVIDVLICNVILKNTVCRDRPCWIDTTVKLLVETPDDYSFPSGHTGFSFAAAISILQYNRKWGIAATILAGLIAISRLYLFVHFPTDVLAGLVVGVLASICAGILVRYFYPILWPKVEAKLPRRKK